MDQKNYARVSYSSAGEDLQVSNYFPPGYVGTYVDIGCWHAVQASNTYLFYQRGWRGLCIDAADFTAEYAESRPDDKFLRSGVGREAGTLTYHAFDQDSSCNTFDPQLAAAHQQGRGYTYTTQQIPVRPINDILAEQGVTKLDFLSVDIEGLDLAILESFDFGRWQPRVIAVEDLQLDLHHAFLNPMVTLLEQRGYVMHAKVFHTMIFFRPMSAAERAYADSIMANRRMLQGLFATAERSKAMG